MAASLREGGFEQSLEGLECETDRHLTWARAEFRRFHADGGATELNLTGMGIRVLPEGFFADPAVAERLTRLDCDMNHLTLLPSTLGGLATLVWFTCSNNRLTSLSRSSCRRGRKLDLGRLSALEEFYCSVNELTALPIGLARLSKLRWFSCNNNTLTELGLFHADLSAELGRLSKLEGLNCSNNRLTCLPAELGQLTGLAEIYCDNNRLSGLPDELGRLPALEKLDCANNVALGAFWAGLVARGEADYKELDPHALALGWRARWGVIAARRVKPAR